MLFRGRMTVNFRHKTFGIAWLCEAQDAMSEHRRDEYQLFFEKITDFGAECLA
jgi:hypothetical protein